MTRDPVRIERAKFKALQREVHTMRPTREIASFDFGSTHRAEYSLGKKARAES
jgi:hypothetical protein